MCTYLLLNQVFGPGTVSLLANRDEAIDRAFDSPAILDLGGARALMPRDHLGGTWLGATNSLLVALTNSPLAKDDPARRSRGLLVRDLLASEDTDAAERRLREATQRDAYNGFNLVIASASRALVASRTDDGLLVRDLPPGTHLVLHRAPGVTPMGRDVVDGGGDPETEMRRAAGTFLASHEPQPEIGHPPCRHEGARGTVATTLLHLHPAQPQNSFMLFSRGPACTASFTRHELP